MLDGRSSVCALYCLATDWNSIARDAEVDIQNCKGKDGGRCSMSIRVATAEYAMAHVAFQPRQAGNEHIVVVSDDPTCTCTSS